MKHYVRLLSYLSGYRRHLGMAIFCGAMVALSTALYAWLIKPILDDIFIRKDRDMLQIIPIVVLVAALLKSLFSYAQACLIQYVGNKIISDIRLQFYHHLILLPVGFHAKRATGSLMSGVISDVALMQTAVSTVIKDFCQHTLTLMALIAVIFYQDFTLACVVVLVIPLGVYPLLQLGKRLKRMAHVGQEKIGDLSSLLQETLSGIRVVKAFGREDFEAGRFSERNSLYVKNLIKVTAAAEIASPTMEAVGGLGLALIVGYGGYQVIGGTLTPGTFFSFMTASMMVYSPLKGLSTANNLLQQAVAAAERVFAILDEKNERAMDLGRTDLPKVQGRVEFRGVSFAYEGHGPCEGRGPSEEHGSSEEGLRPALSSVSLTAFPGEVIAVVGVSGAGKTTLVNLIPRFYEPTGGMILIDGVPIRDVTLSSLRRSIGIVSQEVVLFDETVRWNIAYGEQDASNDRVLSAAEAAYADHFISKMPKGYDTPIIKGGGNLSGGERQRLAIARAIFKDPPILILDEATSALDSEAEFMVRKAMINLMKNRTTFVIAHRLATVQRATRIVVMEQGCIVEVGRHEELIRKEGPYRRIFKMQFRDETLTAEWGT